MEQQFYLRIKNDKHYFLIQAIKKCRNPDASGYWIELIKVPPLISMNNYDCDKCDNGIWTNEYIFSCTCNKSSICENCYKANDYQNTVCNDDTDEHVFNNKHPSGYIYCDDCRSCFPNLRVYECVECLKEKKCFDLCESCFEISEHVHSKNQFVQRDWLLSGEELQENHDLNEDPNKYIVINEDKCKKLEELAENFIGKDILDTKKYRIDVIFDHMNSLSDNSVRLYYQEYTIENVSKWILNIIERNKHKLNSTDKHICFEEIHGGYNPDDEETNCNIIRKAMEHLVSEKLIEENLTNQYTFDVHHVQYGMCVFAQPNKN